MPLVVQHAEQGPDTVPIKAKKKKFVAFGNVVAASGKIEKHVVQIETEKNWYGDPKAAREVCNSIIEEVTGKKELPLPDDLNDKISVWKINPPMSEEKRKKIDECLSSMMQMQVENNTSPNIQLTADNIITALNDNEAEIVMGDLALKDMKQNIKTVMGIPFVYHRHEKSNEKDTMKSMYFLLLPFRLQYNVVPGMLNIETLVGTHGKTDRYIPRHNKARFEYASQKMNCANTIDISKAVTRAEQHALLAHDNLDFMQSLGMADVPHSTTALHSNALGMHIYINSCSLQGERHVVQNIYF